ncbi:hypothetical protein AAG570_008924 [Ranatra chinensis]|uniref:Uncharacterized protein n=1 Tax=Ranatra chinensis TaxID=642074 RepID=A0ABD0Z568_9HEMI
MQNLDKMSTNYKVLFANFLDIEVLKFCHQIHLRSSTRRYLQRLDTTASIKLNLYEPRSSLILSSGSNGESDLDRLTACPWLVVIEKYQDWSCVMKLVKCLLVLLIINGGEGASLERKGDDGNTIVKDIDVDRTVKEVEEILKNDPSLPRLTKGEILSLIEEVKQQQTKQHQRGSKSLMVVLPYSGNSSSSLEDLFTKAPVTEMFHDTSDTITKHTTTTPKPIVSSFTSTSTTTGFSTTTETSPSTVTTKRPKRRRKPSSKKPQRTTTSTPPSPVYKPLDEEETTGEEPTTVGQWVPFEPVKPHKPPQHPHLPPIMQDTLGEIDPAVESEPVVYVTPPKKQIPKPTTNAPNLAEGAEGLSSDMKTLLSEFGLLKLNGGAKKTETTTKGPSAVPSVKISPTVDPTSYMRFKPLPESGPDMSEDMKSFLANFGLIPSKRRRNKALIEPSTRPPKLIRLDDVPAIHEEIFSPEMKQVLEDLGLMEADRKRRAKSLKQQHVFNPTSSVAATDAEKLAKINKLLKKIRELAEDKRSHSLSQEEIRELLVRELGEDVAAGGLLGAAQPDPLSLDELADVLESNKNEVKRQQPETTTQDAESTDATPQETTYEDTTSAEETTTTSTTEAATERTPSFDDLNESFGGPVTTTARPNGLYFLLDWNTFLNVGTEERKVELNFSPKVGNPSLFLPVNVP